MKPLRNSVWTVKENTILNLPDRFRILETYPKQDIAVIFEIKPEKNKLSKPKKVELSKLVQAIRTSQVSPSEFQLPGIMTLSEKELHEDWITDRNSNYSIIEPLIKDHYFLLRLVTNPRFQEIVIRADKLSIDPSSVHRPLNRYWRYGQIRNAFVPFYANCGNKGKQKKSSDKKRGRPRKKSEFGFSFFMGVTTSETDKEIFKRGIEKHYDEGKRPNKKNIWKTVIEEYADEIFCAEKENRPAEIPDFRAFEYWLPLLVDEITLEKQRLGENFWDKEHRALLGSVSENVHAPGDRFEIDSTIADVYVVSEVDRNTVIGRPIIYVIVDEASRMVVGLHVSIYWASWEEAKKALANAFLPKEEYCKQYGLDYEEIDWPCRYISRGLLADRAEFLGESSTEYTDPLGIQVQLCRAFRGDWKAVVERNFGIANEESLHDLAGTTRGQLRKRGEKDPRDEAFYTLNEITTLLITLFVEYNKSQQLDCLVERDFISEDIDFTPINYWNWHIERHTDSLSTIEADLVRAELLPSARATVTGQGIECDGLWYSCEEGEKDNWFVLAKKNGAYQLQARKDNNSNVLWVRPEKGSKLIRCYLLGRSKLYKNLPQADVVYIQEWKQHKKEKSGKLGAKLRYAEVKNRIDENAKQELKNTKTKNNIKGKRQNIRENRKMEQERLENNYRSECSVIDFPYSGTVKEDDELMFLIEKACSDDDF